MKFTTAKSQANNDKCNCLLMYMYVSNDFALYKPYESGFGIRRK